MVPLATNLLLVTSGHGRILLHQFWGHFRATELFAIRLPKPIAKSTLSANHQASYRLTRGFPVPSCVEPALVH